MILITRSGEFTFIFYLAIFCQFVNLVSLYIFLANFTPFGRVVFFVLFGVFPVLLQGVSFSGLEIVNQS